MVEYDENGYAAELKEKPVCRFCLSQDDALTNIYSTKSNSQVSLTIQIMACVSIEVFADDEMPNTICYPCRLLMDFCYRFKQMCKKADQSLRQYPLTGVLERLEHPKFPAKLIQAPVAKTIKIERDAPLTAQTLKRKLPQTITISSPPKRMLKSHHIENDICIEDMVVEFADEQMIEESPVQPKILNIVRQGGPMKILNKQASAKSIEPVLRPPILKTNEDGKIEVVSEIMETDDTDLLDPIKNAAPVETNVFPCNYCERSFPLRQLLDIHVANHVRDRKFQCVVCKKGFFSKYDLGKHKLIHTGEKPFKCVVCGRAFSRSTLLRRHEQKHSDQPKFLCSYCDRAFLSKDEWEKHTQNHQKKRPFSCEYCGKSFAFKQGLERHEVVHSTDQPYKCEHCDQGFSTQGKLARHLTAHAGDRPYPCRICDKSYLLSHHLTRHMRSHKENNQIAHKCSECDLTFSKRDELIAHSSVHATENLVCPLCKTCFENADDVSGHIKQHTDGENFACEFCDLIFLTETQLHEHSDTQHLEEIELYDMANANEDSLDESGGGDGDGDYETVKEETAEIIEYTEQQVEVITQDVEQGEPFKIRTNTRSYGKSNSKPNIQSIKVEKTIELKPSPKVIERVTEQESELKTLAAKSTVRSPNTRASVTNSTRATSSATTSDKATISTRSSKISPAKRTALEKPVSTVAQTKRPTSQVSLTKFITVKQRPSSEQNESGSPQPSLKKLIPLQTMKSAGGKDEVKVAAAAAPPKVSTNKLVKIRMTKAQIEALTKEGKIAVRGGQVISKIAISPKKK